MRKMVDPNPSPLRGALDVSSVLSECDGTTGLLGIDVSGKVSYMYRVTCEFCEPPHVVHHDDCVEGQPAPTMVTQL